MDIRERLAFYLSPAYKEIKANGHAILGMGQILKRDLSFYGVLVIATILLVAAIQEIDIPYFPTVFLSYALFTTIIMVCCARYANIEHGINIPFFSPDRRRLLLIVLGINVLVFLTFHSVTNLIMYYTQPGYFMFQRGGNIYTAVNPYLVVKGSWIALFGSFLIFKWKKTIGSYVVSGDEEETKIYQYFKSKDVVHGNASMIFVLFVIMAFFSFASQNVYVVLAVFWAMLLYALSMFSFGLENFENDDWVFEYDEVELVNEDE